MALVIADRVRETTSSVGTGAVTLTGAFLGFQPFSVIGNGNTTYYAIIDAAAGTWEVGVGTYTSSGNTLSRDTVLDSSNAGAPVNFASGLKDVICTQPAERAVLLDSATNATIPGITLSGGTANGVAYLNGSKVLTTGSNATYDGTRFSLYAGSAPLLAQNTAGNYAIDIKGVSGTSNVRLGDGGDAFLVSTSGSEQMRLNSTGLGIGTNSPAYKLDVAGVARLGNGVAVSAPSATDILSTAHTILSGAGANYLTFGQYPAGQLSAQWIQSSFANPTTATYNLILQPLGGNVGIGTSTPSTKLNVIGDVQLSRSTSASDAALNFGSNSNNYIYSGNSSNVMAFAVNSSERMRITSTGNVGIGLTNPDIYGKFVAFGGQAGASASSAAFATAGAAQSERTDLALYSTFTGTADNGLRRTADIVAGFTGTWGTEYLTFNVGNNGAANDGRALTSEKIRIDSSGRLLVGTSSEVQNASTFFSASSAACVFYRPLNTVGAAITSYFSDVGGVQTFKAFVDTSGTFTIVSDARTKKNVEKLALGIDVVSQLNPVSFNWVGDEQSSPKTVGFIAQEVEAVYPLAVTTFDASDSNGFADQKMMKNDALIPLLTAAIQEQQAIITAQAAQIQQLREKVLEVEEGTSNMLVENTNNLYETITALTARVAALESN